MLRHYSNTILQVLDPLLSTLRSGSGAHDIHCMLERCSLDIIGKIGFETDFQSQKVSCRVESLSMINFSTVVKQTGSNPFSRAGQAILAEASRRLFQPKFVWKALEVVQARAARQGLKLLRDTVDSAATASATSASSEWVLLFFRVDMWLQQGQQETSSQQQCSKPCFRRWTLRPSSS